MRRKGETRKAEKREEKRGMRGEGRERGEKRRERRDEKREIEKMYMCVRTCIYVRYMCVCSCLCVYLCLCVCVCVCMYVFVCVCVCVRAHDHTSGLSTKLFSVFFEKPLPMTPSFINPFLAVSLIQPLPPPSSSPLSPFPRPLCASSWSKMLRNQRGKLGRDGLCTFSLADACVVALLRRSNGSSQESTGSKIRPPPAICGCRPAIQSFGSLMRNTWV